MIMSTELTLKVHKGVLQQCNHRLCKCSTNLKQPANQCLNILLFATILNASVVLPFKSYECFA